MSRKDQSHHHLDPLNEAIDPTDVIDWVERRYDGTPSEEEIRTALERTNGYVLPVQRTYAAQHGEIAWPVFLRVRGESRTRPILHVGQRFRIHAYREKKRTGDFEITQIRTWDSARGMDSHHIICKRVLETKVSEADENHVTFPHTAFDSAIPWDHYNRVAWEVLEYIRSKGHMLSFVTAPDPSDPETSSTWDLEESDPYVEVLPHPHDEKRSILEHLQPSATMSDHL